MPINLKCSCGAETTAGSEQEAIDLTQAHVDQMKATEEAARLAALTAGKRFTTASVEHTAICTQTRTLFVLSQSTLEKSKDVTTWHDYFDALKAEDYY